MVLNYIWVFFIVAGFIYALVRVLFLGDYTAFEELVSSVFSMSEVAVNISIGLIGAMTFWLGIMRIGEKAGFIALLSNITAPFFSALFPSIPKGHPSIGAMIMNFSANMLGLDNAATPLGLKAMQSLQEINPKKDTASDAQILFLVLNSSGLTLIPVSIMAIRASMGAQMPADIFMPILFTTFCSSLAGLLITSLFQKINLFTLPVLLVVGTLSLCMAMLFKFVQWFPTKVSLLSSLGGNFLILLIIIAFIVWALIKKLNVYEQFIEGAKDGFKTSIQIIPYLVAMLVAIGIFRSSGILEAVLIKIEAFFSLFVSDTSFTKALPTAFMKPLSGSGARGMMVDAINTYGVDSLVGRMTSVMQGSTETTFYVLAVYFGAVKIKFSRHAVFCGLFADFIGVIAAIVFSYLFFS